MACTRPGKPSTFPSEERRAIKTQGLAGGSDRRKRSTVEDRKAPVEATPHVILRTPQRARARCTVHATATLAAIHATLNATIHAILDASTHAILDATTHATLHSALDLSECVTRQRQNRGYQNPSPQDEIPPISGDGGGWPRAVIKPIQIEDCRSSFGLGTGIPDKGTSEFQPALPCRFGFLSGGVDVDQILLVLFVGASVRFTTGCAVVQFIQRGRTRHIPISSCY